MGTTKTKIIKVCAYARVSTSSDDQVNSFDNQKTYFERRIRENKQYEFHKIYADRGISGTSLNKREQFNLMLWDAGLDERKVSGSKRTVFIASDRQPRFTLIMVKNTSRFARNVLVIDVLRELLKKNVHVYFLDIDLLFDSVDKEFMLNLFLNFAQQESLDKSTKVRFGHAESARKGRIFTNGNIYGYDYSTETKELTVREDEAEVVRKTFEWYAEGLGIRRILNRLEEEGHRTRQGKPFVPSFIKRMLTQEKYVGTLVRNKYDSGVVFNKHTPTVKDEEDWLVFENRVPAIITKELFDKCNKLRTSKVNHKNQKGVNKGQSEFAGKIYCSKCNSTYTRNVDRGRVFYNCGLKKTKGTTACDGKNVNLTKIEDVIDDIIKEGIVERFTLQKARIFHLISQRIDELQERIDNPADEELKGKLSELADVEQEEDRLTRLVVKGQIKEQLFDEMKIDIDDRKSKLKREIQELSATNGDLLREISMWEDRLAKLEAIETKDSYEREEIMEIISKITVQEDGSLTYELGLFTELTNV